MTNIQRNKFPFKCAAAFVTKLEWSPAVSWVFTQIDLSEEENKARTQLQQYVGKLRQEHFDKCGSQTHPDQRFQMLLWSHSIRVVFVQICFSVEISKGFAVSPKTPGGAFERMHAGNQSWPSSKTIKSIPGCRSAGKHQDNKQLLLKAQNAHPAIKDWLVRPWDSSHCLHLKESLTKNKYT